MEIYKKLLKIQTKLKAPKSQFNSFGKYNYRSCEDILEAIKPLLSEVGAVLTISDQIINIGERFYIEATTRIIDVETGESIENKALAREDETKKGQDLAQVTGSTSSYARKYALNGLFCIDDTKDSDATNEHGSKTHLNNDTEQKQSNDDNTLDTISKAQQGRLFALAKGNTKVAKEILQKHGFTESKEIPKGKVYEDICKEIEAAVKAV